MKLVRSLCLLPWVGLLASCHAIVLDPAGDIAVQQRNMLVESTLLMLLIIVPVMTLTVLFAWRYRASNTQAPYEPDWDHSTQLELIIWAGPLLIIICLGALTWVGTHLLDPYRALGRVRPDRPGSPVQAPLRVDAVAMDWKWLFIYPEYRLATVNELAVPIDRPIDFHITASGVMNAFYVPALAGMIYAMPGMETRLHAVANRPGDYLGLSANYSGAGFAGMHFRFRALPEAGFASWLAQAQQATAGASLDRTAYLQLQQPSEDEPVRYFSATDAGLFEAIVERCVERGKMCSSQMMAIDAHGGLGLAGVYNVGRLDDDKAASRAAIAPQRTLPARRYVAALCTPTDPSGAQVGARAETVPDDTPLLGRGLLPPGRPAAASPREQAAAWSPLAPRGASL